MIFELLNRTDDITGIDVLDTSLLNKAIAGLHCCQESWSEERFQSWRERMRMLVASLQKRILHIFSETSIHFANGGWLFLGLLYDALISSYKRFSETGSSLFTTLLETFAVDMLKDVLKMNGWCPSQIEDLDSASAAYYGVLMGPRQVSHRGCSLVTCSRTAINEDYYAIHHVPDLCLDLMSPESLYYLSPTSAEPAQRAFIGPQQGKCPMIGVSVETLVELIEGGLVPLVTVPADTPITIKGYDIASCIIYGRQSRMA